MAQLSQEQLKQLLDRGLTLSQVQQIASKRGDTVPSPTLLGYIAKPFVGAALRAGQAVGAVTAQALGADQQRLQGAIEESRILKAPLLGTLAFEGQKPITTQRGQQQLLGQTIETAGTIMPVGRAVTTLKPFLGRTGALATSLGVGGYGIETGTKLQEGAPQPFAPGLGTFIPAGIPIAGKVLSGVAPTFRYGIAKTTGLNQETVKLALTKPQALQDAQKEGLNRLNLAELLNERVKTLTDEVSEAGAKYDPIRNSGQVVTFTENPIQKVLNKYKLTISNGAVRVSPESPPLSNGDITALERFIAQFGEQQQYSANAFLNARQGLDVMAKWQQGLDKTASIKNIARDLRQEFDAVGKKTIKGLKEVDEEFAPVRSELGKIRKEYLELRDGKWQLKDSTMSRIANATNLGRDKVLQRLEQYVPGITQQIQLVKALEDLARASDGRNVGAYLPSILLGGGALTALSNPITAALAAMVALPQVAIPILIAFGKLNGIAQSVMRALVGKLLVGKTLTEQELLIYKNAIINHLNQISPGDQFFSSPTGKRVTEYLGELNRNPRLGLQLEDVSKKDGFQGFTDLSTKLLEKLKGRTTVSRQFIEDLSNSPDLKQAERDLIRRVLGEYEYAKSPELVGSLRITNHNPVAGLDNITLEKSVQQVDPLTTTYDIIVGGQPVGKVAYGRQTFSKKDAENLRSQGFDEDQIQTQVEKNKGLLLIQNIRLNPEIRQRGIGSAVIDKIFKDNPRFNRITFLTPDRRPPFWEKIGAEMSGIEGMLTKENFYKNYNKTQVSDQISVPDFANKVKSELLPLQKMEYPYKPSKNKYESITLPDELRGPIANYDEHIYNSPIKTSAGDTHFPGYTDSYFAHTRIEDLPDNTRQPDRVLKIVQGTSERRPFKVVGDGVDQNFATKAEAEKALKDFAVNTKNEMKTRRVIEIQSDLFQKGRLEKETEKLGKELRYASPNSQGIDNIEQEYRALQYKKASPEPQDMTPAQIDARMRELEQEMRKATAEIKPKIDVRKAEIAKLEPYRNTWHERVIREEVKKAAQDGKTKLQFPTGETAMKIEGLGSRNNWVLYDEFGENLDLTEDLLKVGKEVKDGAGHWIITDVLGDGKFKATPESDFRMIVQAEGAREKALLAIKNKEYPNINVEEFDISGKVDTENPIYKFYEKEVGKYLKNKYGAQLITDPQGVKWWEVQIKPEMKKLPIEAFGVGAVPLLTQNEDE